MTLKHRVSAVTLTALLLLVYLNALPSSVVAAGAYRGSATDVLKGPISLAEETNVLEVDPGGNIRGIGTSIAEVRKPSGEFAFRSKVGAFAQSGLLLRQRWVYSMFHYPGFSAAPSALREWGGDIWLSFDGRDLVRQQQLVVRNFVPELKRSWFTIGSPESIALERPMFISLEAVPHVEWVSLPHLSINGSWTEQRPAFVDYLAIGFHDIDTRGQTVAFSRSWLATYGIQNPIFRHADGTAIPTKDDQVAFYAMPAHFSILYVFTGSEAFTKESDQAHSDVHYDSANRRIYVLSDRWDPVGANERMRSPAPLTYDATSSFTVRATWRTTQQGNWQLAVPMFFMGASNTRVDMANSFYVLYQSRDSNLGWQPQYFLRFVDSGGVQHINYAITTAANVQVEFMFAFNSDSRVITMAMYRADGSSLGSTSYTLGASEGFSLGKVGAGAWGLGDPNCDPVCEPLTIAWTDNIYFNANAARNGNFEYDSDSDGVPDNWQPWIWTKGPVYRSQEHSHWNGGLWSVKIADTSITQDYGLQTVRMTASPGASFVGSAWVYVVSGTNWLCIEYWDSSGNRIGAACKTTRTTYEFEYVDLTYTAPTGTSQVDLLVYSSSSNTGTGYFDLAELRLRRSFWSVNVHNGEPALPAGLAGWQVAIDKAADAGVSYIRTDFPWNAFQPDPDVWDGAVVTYFQTVRDMAKTRGIDLIAILKGPEPWWINSDNVYDKFYAFCAGIGARFDGGSIPYFQIMNEPNLESNIGDQNILVPRCYEGLLAAGALDEFTHKSEFKTIGNLFVQLFWDTFMRNWLTATGRSLDIIAIDYYPETNNPFNNCNDWAPLDTLFQIMQDFDREGAIMETGYANRDYGGNWREDTSQDFYITCALPVIYDKGSSHNAAFPTIPLLMANWYELFDHSTGGLLPLDTYGLVHSDLTNKVGYANFRTRVPGFNF
jgi:hypothetical protein